MRAWSRYSALRARESLQAQVSGGCYQTKALDVLPRALNDLRVLGLFDGKGKRGIYAVRSCPAPRRK